MVEVKIYPACLKCECSKFASKDSLFPWDFPSQKHNAIIRCENEHICKFIDGQEPIEIGNTCTLTYNGDISGTDAPSYVCDKCGYEANLDDAKFCGGCGASVVEIK